MEKLLGRILGRLAKQYHIKERTIRRYLSEAGVNPIRIANKKFLKGKQAQKNLKFLRKMKRETK
jgi:hypothetical protein